MPTRNNILLKKLPQPKLVQLSNGRIFYARYQRVGRHEFLPTNVCIQGAYIRKIGPQRQRKRRARVQTGSGYINQNMIMHGIDLAKRDANTDLGRMIIKDAIDFVLTACNLLKNKLF